MVSCKQCTTLNSLDSTFCKKCGGTLADADIAVAQEKLTAMIADGHKLFTDGRTEEAMMVAETAVRTNPQSAAALSLKGMCHERSGQLAEALECFERVIELNPDSVLDKIKVNDLKNLMVSKQLETPKPDRRTAILAAVAASVLVVAIGAFAAKSALASSGDGKVASNQPVMTADPNLQGFGNVSNGAQQPGEVANQQSNAQSQDANRLGSNPNPTAQSNGSSQREPVLNTYRGNGELPGIRGGGTPGFDPNSLSIKPLDPNISGPIGGGSARPSNDPGAAGSSSQGQQRPPSQDPDPEPPTGGSDPEQKVDPEAPGIIEIKVSGNGKPNEAGAAANTREGMLRQAREHYSRGEFQAAANTYERALRAGADPASTNQRLAQCYEKMGRSSDAVAAYGRAANAFESIVKSGRGDSSRAAAAMEACRQAIKVLGG